MRPVEVEDSLSTVLEINRSCENVETQTPHFNLTDVYFKVPPILLTLSGCFGCFAMILWIIGAYESAATFIGILGVLLFLSGIGAAFMVYDLRTLAGHIQYLRRIRLVLTKNVQDLENQFHLVKEQNVTMSSNVDMLLEENKKLDQQQAELEESTFDLRQDIKGFEEANDMYRKELRELNAVNNRLNSTVVEITKDHKQLSEALTQFSELQEQLSQHAEDCGIQNYLGYRIKNRSMLCL